MKTFFRRALTVSALALGLIGTAVAPAVATENPEIPTAAAATAEVSPAAAVPDYEGSTTPVPPSRYLSTVRWSEASGEFHGRFDQFLQTDVIAFSQRTVTQSLIMGTGNIFYNVTQGILQFAIDLSPMDALGETADKTAATIGESLYENSPIVAALLVIIVGGVIFSIARGGARPWRRIITASGVIALMAVMTAGASASTTVNGDFRPGLGSPGWIATKINDTVTTIATVPSEALALSTPVVGQGAASGTGCSIYMKNMADRYQDTTDSTGSIPLIISSLWESTGLIVWKQTQYGSIPYNTQTGATYGDEAFCHQLDWQAGVGPTTQAIMTFGTIEKARAAGFAGESTAWGSEDNDTRDRSLVAWAACEVSQTGSVYVRGQFTLKADGSAWITDADCRTWWTTDQSLPVFNVGGKASDAAEFGSNPAVTEFLKTLHGNDNASGLMLVYTYAFSALLIMLVFGALSFSIIVAKFAAVIMIISVMFVLLLSLVSPNSMGSKLLQFLKTYVGFTVFAFAATLILSLVTLMSKLVSQAGSEAFGTGTIMAILWTGASPVIACVLVSLVFTRMLKLPGVFKPSSAMAWGAAGGAVGGTLGNAFAQREGRATSMAKGAMNRAGKSATSYALNGAKTLLPGGRAVRPGRMAPAGAGAAGAGFGGAAGAAAGTAAGAAAGRSGARENGKSAVDPKFLAEAQKWAASNRTAKPNRQERMDAIAQKAGHGTRLGLDAAVATARASRNVLEEVKSPEFRSELRGRSSAAVTRATTAMKSAGDLIHDDPVLAAQLGAGLAGDSIRRGSRAATAAVRQAAPNAIAAGWKGTKTVYGAARSAAAHQGIRDAASVGRGLVLGSIAAGPVGGAVGIAAEARGVQRRRAERTEQQTIADFTEHLRVQAEEKAAKKKAKPAE